jgi:phage terminase large subunit GpA-like protein
MTAQAFGEAHRIYTDGPRTGFYRADSTPWAPGIYDALSEQSPWREVYVVKGAQLGLTEIGMIWIGDGAVQGLPGLVIEPTERHAHQIASRRWTGFVNTAQPLRDLFGGGQRQSALQFTSDTTDVTFAGSGSPASFVSAVPARVLVDDYDRCSRLKGEGGLLPLMRDKIDVWGERGKLFIPSTPAWANDGIWPEWLRTDQRLFECPCPLCGHRQPWVWEDLRWNPGQPETVHLTCRSCRAGQVEWAWKSKWRAGQWRATAAVSDPKRVGFHLSTLYAAPGTQPWERIARFYEEARDSRDPLKLQVFINSAMALPDAHTKIGGAL